MAPSSDLRYDSDGYLTSTFKCLFSAFRGDIGLPERILFCFDGKPKTIKRRPPKPPDWYSKLGEFQRVIKEGFGEAAHTLHSDHESDDTVATVVARMACQGRRVVVVSGDKDLQQLALPDGQVSYFCLNKKRLLTAAEICDRWGVKRPIQVAVALAIIGDVGDGVNGVDKMAAKAVQRIFNGLSDDASLDLVVEVAARQMTESQKAQFYESLELTLLHLDVQTDAVPVPFDPVPSLSLGGRAGDEWARGIAMLDPEGAIDAVQDWTP
jgi:5'-3' exonuclease